MFKSKTFWGAFLFIAVKALESFGIVPIEPATLLESAGIGLGLYGARNTAVKK